MFSPRWFMVMTRYFFDTNDEQTASRDDLGLDCVTMAEVEQEALRGLVDMARDLLPSAHQSLSISVRDEAGRPVLHATLTLTVSRP